MTAMEGQYRDHEEQLKGIVKEKLAEHAQLMDLLSDVQRQRALQSSKCTAGDTDSMLPYHLVIAFSAAAIVAHHACPAAKLIGYVLH